jgi:hypothetical protein
MSEEYQNVISSGLPTTLGLFHSGTTICFLLLLLFWGCFFWGGGFVVVVLFFYFLRKTKTRSATFYVLCILQHDTR